MPPKRDTFSRSIMYPVNFPGLGRGLDFLLPSFLVSRQGPYRGREVFLGTFSRSITYSAYFLGLGRGLDFLLPSFLSSRKEKKVGAWGQSPRFIYSKINIFGKCDPFSRSIMYPVNFPGLGRGLDFLLPSFLSSRKEKKVGAWGQSPRFLYPKINISRKCTAFPSFIEYEHPKSDAFSDY